MKYGNVNLKVVVGTLSRTKRKAQEIRHYPGTDKSDIIDKGKMATIITCTLKAETESERILIEQLLHSTAENELAFDNYYYKKVVTGGTGTPKPIDPAQSSWLVDAEFISLDPIPYDVNTGEALY